MKVVLSGMSSMEQLKENITTYDEEKPLNEKEMDALMQVTDQMLAQKAVPCTACHYCVSYCPKQLDIPHIMALYNQFTSTRDTDFIAPMALAGMPMEKHPSACIASHSCERVCPQQIHISQVMDTFAKGLGERN